MPKINLTIFIGLIRLPQQNMSFSDHYIDVVFNLSNVMFIATANELYPIPLPLYDRMKMRLPKKISRLQDRL